MENSWRFRRFSPPARSTTTCCRQRCGSSSARATFETEPIPSLSSDGRLAIEPTNDPSVLTIRWFGSRHVLHVPRAAAVHAARSAAGARPSAACSRSRYRAIFDPKQMLERGDLFRGAIEDRYVGAFLDSPASGDADAAARRSPRDGDRGAARRRALQLREPRHLLGRAAARQGRRSGTAAPRRAEHAYRYSQALTGDQELLPALRRPATRCSSSIAAAPCSTSSTSRRVRHARCRSTCRARRPTGRMPLATVGNAQHLHRPQPVARDQGVRAGRADLQLPQRALAPARRRGEVRHVGGGRRQPRAGRAAVPDRARSRRRAAGGAVRRAARSGGALPQLVAPGRPARRASHGTPGDGADARRS